MTDTTVNFNQNQLSELIRQDLSKEEIYLQLLQQGHKVEEIENAFESSARSRSSSEIQKHTVQVVVVLGAILLAFGIFSFIASNWRGIHAFLKVAIILIAMILAYAGGWLIKEQRGYNRTGMALYFLGTLIYGSGIYLVAQIFNIRADWPDGLILWMLGSLLMALVLRSYLHLYLGVILGLIAIVNHPFVLLSRFAFDPFLLTSSILLAIATIASFGSALYLRRSNLSEI